MITSAQIKTSADYIISKTNFRADAGIILGSGLGGLVDKLEIKHSLSYSDIPGFPVSTVQGHGNRLLFGILNGVHVVVMQGRFHFYEGYSMQEITFPVRVMKAIGIKKLLLSNASGGVNPNYKVGDLMIIEDHINLMGINPLIGPNDEKEGPRFPDMSEPYDPSLRKKAKEIGSRLGYDCHSGVYASVTGPTFETKAEYKYIRIIGADCVGMSTVPEVIVARHMNLPVFAMSVITDLGGNDQVQPITHEEVLHVAGIAGQKLTEIFAELIVF